MKLRAKSVAALLSAVVLTVAMGVTSFAAGSASTNGVATVKGATDKNGNPVTATISASSQAAPSTESLKDILGDSYVEGMSVVDVMDVTVPDGTAFPVTITFNVPGVTANSKVAALHYNGNAWEKVEAKAGDAVVTATFTSLSPVAIVADKAASDGAAVSSPKTGETAPIAMIGAVAVIAAAAAYGLKKKAL